MKVASPTEMRAWPRGQLGFTLVELMVVVAVLAILAVLAAPSLRDMILMQRLRAINAQLVTDMQAARGEAINRRQLLRVNFRNNSSQTCYTLYLALGNDLRCNCTGGAGGACTDSGTEEIRTVSVPRSTGVTTLPALATVPVNYAFAFDPVTGGLLEIPSDDEPRPMALAELETRVDANRRLRTQINTAGRVSVCSPVTAVMQGAAC